MEVETVYLETDNVACSNNGGHGIIFCNNVTIYGDKAASKLIKQGKLKTNSSIDPDLIQQISENGQDPNEFINQLIRQHLTKK